MALTGLQIQKLLPKTNCKECGSNTCLAFAMKLAGKKAELSECPYASEEAKQVLGAASEPPVRSVELGEKRSLKLGAETVLYRHEKTFVNQTAFAVSVFDTDSVETVDNKLAEIKEYTLERVGEVLKIDLVAVVQKGSDAAQFAALAKKAHEVTGCPLVLVSPEIKALDLAALAVKGSRSILVAPNEEATQELKAIAIQNQHALAITAKDINGIVKITSQLKEQGFNDVLINFNALSLAQRFQINSLARRAALKDGVKALGYPVLAFAEGDLVQTTVTGITEVAKFGGVCVLPSFNKAQLASLFTFRLNIYTDPQKPIQVEPKLYPIGEPTPSSPVFVTTNFSLTYFIVSGEIENAGLSAWLVVPECEGMSVLTAWAAGKFSGTSIAKFIKENGIEQAVTTRQIIIPGYVAQISGELQEGLPGWKVMVGPQEAADLESFIKARLS